MSARILERPECAWITRELEHEAQGYAVANVVPEHLAEVRGPKLALIAKTEAAVKDRLTKEINTGTTAPMSSSSRSRREGPMRG